VARCGHIVVFLRNQMAKRQWSIQNLAEALGLPRNSTSPYPWIKGTSAPGATMRHKLAELFEVPVATFMARDPGEHLPVHAPGTFTPPGPVGKMLHELQRPVKPTEVLAFSVSADGIARIRLDVSLPLATATPLLRMLLDAGLVFSDG
jgi:transcriptional regulator with XRE-family HTH domain